MQVAYIPQPKAVQPAKSQQAPKQSNDSSFLSTLNQKLNETSKAPVDTTKSTQNVPKEPVLSDDTADESTTPQIIDIPITAVMLPLIEAFTEQQTSATTVMDAPVEPAQTAQPAQPTPITTVVSPNTTMPVGQEVKTADIVDTEGVTGAQAPTENAAKLEQINSQNLPNETVEVPVKEPVLAEKVATGKVEHHPQVVADLPNTPNELDLPKAKIEMASVPVEVITKAVAAEPLMVLPKAQAVANEPKLDLTDVSVEGDLPQAVPTDAADDLSQATSSGDNENAEQSEGDSTKKVNKDETSNLSKEFTAFELQAGRNVVTISDVAARIDANTKVAEPQAQLSDAIKQNLAAGRTEFEMQLTPVNLGKITVKMVAENGMLTVEFIADNPKTQALLQNNSGEIRELIQAANGTHQVITPNHSSESMPQNYTQQERNQQQNQQNQPEQHGQAEQEGDDQIQTTADFLSVLQQMKQYRTI